MTIGSLFSGIGGLELGLERAGLGPVLWQVEIDPFCRAVLARHWPTATRYPDVRELRGAALAPVDVLCGGFPCQDVSSAGLRRRRGLDVVAGGLAALGYRVEATRIRAADVGAPHLRERVFLVGVAEPAGERRSVPRGEQDGGGLAAAVGGGAAAVADAHLRRREGERLTDGAREQGPHGHVAHRRAARGRGDGQADLDGDGPAQPRVGGGAHGVPAGLDGAGPGGAWPATRGEPQAEWEPARTAPGRDADGRKLDLNRPARLRALGNAVVPQVAYVVGCRVREMCDLPVSR